VNDTGGRSHSKIFSELYKHLRVFNPDVPESAERVDPLLRMLLQVYSYQLAQIDSQLGKTWSVAKEALVKAVCPYPSRCPIPAQTIVKCTPVDPVVDIDPDVKFFHREEREGGKIYFFSPLVSTRLIDAEVSKILLMVGKSVVDVGPSVEDQRARSRSIAQVQQKTQSESRLHVGIKFSGPRSAMNGALMFVHAARDLRLALRWSDWHRCLNDGRTDMESHFCPGTTGGIKEILAGDTGRNWGSLRDDTDIFGELEDSFVVLPSGYSTPWEAGSPDPSLVETCTRVGIDVSADDKLYWLTIHLPKETRLSLFDGHLDMRFDTAVAINRSEISRKKHTAGNRYVEIELPEKLDSILGVESVVDSRGDEYVARGQDLAVDPRYMYTLDERENRLVIMLDFSIWTEPIPEEIRITYSLTDGVSANGISPGGINSFYESHPGVSDVTNLTTTRGAVPAKSTDQILMEAGIRLRQRDRALTFEDIVAWAKTYDSRINEVKCSNGVERLEGILRRCVVVDVTVDSEEFHGDKEIEVLGNRLSRFLKERSAVNSQYLVRILKT
jgi:hypothetical protein